MMQKVTANKYFSISVLDIEVESYFLSSLVHAFKLVFFSGAEDYKICNNNYTLTIQD